MVSQESALPIEILGRRDGRALTDEGVPPSALRHGFSASLPSGIAVIGNHLPRRCGIATFTTDLCDAISEEYEKAQLLVVAVNDPGSHYEYPPRIRFELLEGDPSSYDDAADFLNSSNVAVVSLQHEYGIYGGPAGGLISRLLRRLKMPVVTTLHTFLREPRRESTYRHGRGCRVVRPPHCHERALLADYARSVPCSRGKDRLDSSWRTGPAIWGYDLYKDSTGTEGKVVLLTLGLLSPNKGIERVIEALPRIVADHPEVVYVIVGATHPHIRQREGDQYRLQLQALARNSGVERNVIFHNRFVSPDEMAQFVGSADIYITPYPYEAQAVSGTLAYAVGAGKAIISTPYWHAAELLAGGRGVLVPFEDSDAIATAATNSSTIR